MLDAARAHGLSVVVAAIREETDPEIDARAAADPAIRVHWMSLGELSRLIETFQAAGVTPVVTITGSTLDITFPNGQVGTGNTVLGLEALSGSGGTFNTAIGVDALDVDTTGEADTAVGGRALLGRSDLRGHATVARGVRHQPERDQPGR